MLFWSTAATAFKITLSGMNYIQLLFYSSLASTIILFIILCYDKNSKIIEVFNPKYFLTNLIRGFVNPFFFYMVIFKAYSILPAQEAMTLNYIWPITISFFSVIFLKTKLTFKIFLGLVIAFLGVFIIATRGDFLSLEFHNIYGVFLAVGSSIIWSTYWILNLKDERNELTKLFGAFFYGTILIFIYILFFDEIILQNYKYLFGAIYIGLFEMGITFYLWLKGLKLSGNKAKTATFVYLSPFLSIIFIAIILKEKLFAYSIIGLIFILSGIFIQYLYLENGKVKIKLK